MTYAALPASERAALQWGALLQGPGGERHLRPAQALRNLRGLRGFIADAGMVYQVGVNM